MPNSLSKTALPNVITAIEENLFAYLTTTGGWEGMEVHDEPALLWTISNVPFPAFNLVCRARLAAIDAGVAIEAAVARARARQVPLGWIIGPSSQPPGLADLLQTYGFILEERVPGMACDLRVPPGQTPAAAGLAIERVVDDGALDRWSATCAAVGELPDFAAAAFAELGRHAGYAGPIYDYLGYLDGVPVGTLTLFLNEGVAGLYNGGTLPAARGQGVFASLMQRAMADARARGCALAVLHATDMSVSQCRRLGFRDYCAIDQYVWEPEAVA